MTAVTAVSWVFATLLAVAGAGKILTPGATGAALQGARLPSDHRLVRALGAGEVALAAVVLFVGGVLPAALLAGAYAVFSAFAWHQSRRGAGCGCFGESDAPATSLHVAVDVAGAAVAAAAAWRPGASLAAVAGADLLLGIAVLALVCLAAVAVRLVLTALPELSAAVATVAGDRT